MVYVDRRRHGCRRDPGRFADIPGDSLKRRMNANAAAAEVRHEIIRKMDRLEKDRDIKDYETAWIELRAFINKMAKRASAKPGGLGRK